MPSQATKNLEPTILEPPAIGQPLTVGGQPKDAAAAAPAPQDSPTSRRPKYARKDRNGPKDAPPTPSPKRKPVPPMRANRDPEQRANRLRFTCASQAIQ